MAVLGCADPGDNQMEASGASPGPRYEPAVFWNGAWQLQKQGFDPDLTGPPGPIHRYKRDVLLTRLLSLLPVEGTGVLEFDCGPGWNLRALSRRKPARLAGADIAPEMCKLARSNTPPRSCGWTATGCRSRTGNSTAPSPMPCCSTIQPARCPTSSGRSSTARPDAPK
jgi:hypothetical protein